MAVITNNIKKRFVKDYNLPIAVFQDDTFDYFIDLYDKLYQTKSKYKLLVETVELFDDEQGFLNAFNRVKGKILDEISSKESYKRLADDRHLQHETIHEIHNGSVYHPDFIDNNVISIDLKQANFNSLRLYDTDLVNNSVSYDEFISGYTDVEYFKQSKQLRQVIFGNLLPKKQQVIQKGIMQEIGDALINKRNFECSVMKAGTDEILIYDFLDDPRIVPDITKTIPEKYKYITKVEDFVIRQVHPEKPFYLKQVYGTKKVTFKNIPTVFFPQVFKNYFGGELHENDLMFYYEGYRAKFIKKIY